MTGGVRARFPLRWIFWVSCGEAVGFAVAAGVAVTVTVLHPDALVAFVVTIVGGAVEGAALGAGQLIGLRRNRPATVPWLAATSAGAATAWAIGLLPSTLELGFLGVAHPRPRAGRTRAPRRDSGGAMGRHP
jgi:hypothetical protein